MAGTLPAPARSSRPPSRSGEAILDLCSGWGPRAPWPVRGGDYGDPTFYSAAAQFATSCVDHDQAWDWSAAIPERKTAIRGSGRRPSCGLFRAVFQGGRNWAPVQLVREGLSLLAEAHTVLPCCITQCDVPIRARAGVERRYGHAVPLEETSQVAALFPNSTFVPVAGAGHGTVFWSDCAAASLLSSSRLCRSGTSVALAPPDCLACRGALPAFWPGTPALPA